MLKPRTLKMLALFLAMYTVLGLPGLFWPSYFDTPAGLLVRVPLLSIYVFHNAGIPGLLEHDGLCGWGWCSPSGFGWVFGAALSVIELWLLAWSVAVLPRRFFAR